MEHSGQGGDEEDQSVFVCVSVCVCLHVYVCDHVTYIVR